MPINATTHTVLAGGLSSQGLPMGLPMGQFQVRLGLRVYGAGPVPGAQQQQQRQQRVAPPGQGIKMKMKGLALCRGWEGFGGRQTGTHRGPMRLSYCGQARYREVLAATHGATLCCVMWRAS